MTLSSFEGVESKGVGIGAAPALARLKEGKRSI
jgi:hypothetical protein